jgi:hypothetical protein
MDIAVINRGVCELIYFTGVAGRISDLRRNDGCGAQSMGSASSDPEVR